jgi:hypothetical protein
MDIQDRSNKSGMRSTSQKQANTRHDFDPIPATAPTPGAFGKEGPPPDPGDGEREQEVEAWRGGKHQEA